MSIFGSMKTAVSAMNAEANRLSTVADNIANVNTVGYKRASTTFSSLVLPSTAGNYNSGGVETSVRRAVSQQGDISYTTSGSDLSIQGDGFFIVRDAAGTPYLTRSGDFTSDGHGNLVNAAGFTLLAYPYGSGEPAVVVNGFSGLVPVNLSGGALSAKASGAGSASGNLKSGADIVSGDTAGVNSAASAYSYKTSLVAYDSLGASVLYDFYYTKTADSEWEVAAFRHDQAASGGGFPYLAGPVGTAALTFGADGQLASPTEVLIADGTQSIAIDLSKISQLAASFSMSGKIDGQAASAVQSFSIGRDGIVSAVYANGDLKPLYKIPLATVASPDRLTLLSGNAYAANGSSGVTVIGFAQSAGFGSIISGGLEGSNVDLAFELTEMIASQRGYTANSKVFQTGSEILDVLVNLKR
ncbi:flagellar hook protein FlgE [Rhizobium ruizarguesonis]|uniref:flagellar hook protein FlgE n=1 Tax=Rhizobium ruizarguesonis TaxID=2081791 RepID=UPI0013C00F29|nr:flagellar hook protein FlgE [Rhizobium ruizarguesonis]NEJ02637.1 flagellar hook-basal body complex protein [Rhizobium ruizarguesonis]NEJ39764.1 flagellar hook-basal body complex protein [Rhizobium ruizarguesonis]